MIIEVTQSDIDLGVAGAGCACPIARAIRRQHQNGVFVGYGYVRDGLRAVALPNSAFQFIRDFDTGRPVTPFRFELNL